MADKYTFWRCPCCGQWAAPHKLQAAARGSYPLEQGRPGGRGHKWKVAPLPERARGILVSLLRSIADKLGTPALLPRLKNGARPPELDQVPLESWPRLGRCAVPACGQPQYDTPGGPCCRNSHGGADTIPD